MMHSMVDTKRLAPWSVILLQLVFLLGALGLFSGAASAARLAYEGTFRVEFANLGKISTFTTATGVATVNGTGAKGHLTTLQLETPIGTLNTAIPITDPSVTAGGPVQAQLIGVRLAPDLQGGIFAPISGGIQSATVLTLETMPQTGVSRICIFNPDCSTALDINLAATVNGVFVGVGVGGIQTIGGAGFLRVSILGAPWTVKTVSVSNRTNGADITTFSGVGFAHGPASGTSSTATTSGVIQLITANQTTVISPAPNGDKTGQLYSFQLHFIPEPSLLLLLGSGALGLAILGRSRLR